MWVCGRWICPHSPLTPSIAREFTFRQAKKKKTGISELEITTVQSTMRIAKNSNFCSTSTHPIAPTDLTVTNVLDSAAGFPVTPKDKTSILFEDRLDNYSLQVLRIVVFFSVLIVVQDDFTCSSCSLFVSRFASTKSSR